MGALMKYTVLVVILVSVAAGGFYAGSNVQGLAGATSGNLVLDVKPGEYPLINPTVTAGIGKHYIINVQPLKNTFAEIQKKYPNKTYVYFAYLNNDSWTGINEREYFTAASTIKVPLAMSLMKAVEDGKISLDSTYTVDQEDLDDNFGDFYKESEGKTYTLRELLRIMLERSDNTASSAIVHALKNIGYEDPFLNVYTFMGWDNYPGLGEKPEYFDVNLKVLSNMFLALYNAKYVNVEHSQEILEYLDNANFNEQIVAGVPSSIAVAHKSGVHEDLKTYSDCGIVYAPSRHYLLCVGSEGAPKTVADKFMIEISKAAYDFVMNN